MIIVRDAVAEDHVDAAELILLSAPYFRVLFGDRVKNVLQNLFCDQSNLFSFMHVCFAEVDGARAGMILSYDKQAKKHENSGTGYLLFKKIGVRMFRKIFILLKFNRTVGSLSDGEYYISNIATYPHFRGLGVGHKLVTEVEREALLSGSEKIVLDVEKENITAIAFYKRMGFRVLEEFSIPLSANLILHFQRMIKKI